MRPALFEDLQSDEQRELSVLNMYYLATRLRRVFKDPFLESGLWPEKLLHLDRHELEDCIELLLNLKEALLYAEE